MEIKDIIRKRREELNLTYEQLGDMIGVGKSTVRKWETGMIENMRRDNIVALSKALNISPMVLMGLDVKNDSLNSDTKTVIKEDKILPEDAYSHGKESFTNFTDYLYSTFSKEIKSLDDKFTDLNIKEIYEDVNKYVSFMLSKLDIMDKKQINNTNIGDLTTATKEDLCFLEDSYTTLAAHDDNLTDEEKQNMDIKITEALKKKRK